MVNDIGGTGSTPAGDVPGVDNPAAPPRPEEPSPENMRMRNLDDFDKISKTVKDPATGKSLFDVITESMFMEFKKGADDRAKRAKEQRKREESR